MKISGNWYEDGHDPCYGCPLCGSLNTCKNCDGDVNAIIEEMDNAECDKADDNWHERFDW